MKRGAGAQSGSVVVPVLVLVAVALLAAGGLRYVGDRANETYRAQARALRTVGGEPSGVRPAAPPPRAVRAAPAEAPPAAASSVAQDLASGVVAGEFDRSCTSWWCLGAQVVHGTVNPLADVRDLAAAGVHVFDEPTSLWAWGGVVVGGARFVPGIGDAAGAGFRYLRRVHVSDLKPSQTEVGAAVADGRADLWRREAADMGMSTEDYARSVLRPKMEQKELPAYIDPAGNYRNTDGHHRVWAMRRLEDETGVKLSVKPDVQRDYRGWDYDDYAEDAVKNLGIRGRPGQSPREIVDALPSAYNGLRDSAMRSLVGKSFIDGGLKGSMFVDFIQFEVGEKLLKKGLGERLVKKGLIAADAEEIPADAARDPRVQQVVNEMLYGDPKMRKFLRKRLRGGKKKRAKREKKLDEAIDAYLGSN